MNNKKTTEIIFIFTCPDGSGQTKACPIKQRMLYSSSKARVVALLGEAGGKVEKSFEFNEPNDIVVADIDQALHPAAAAPAAAFARPAKPGRGPRCGCCRRGRGRGGKINFCCAVFV